MIDVGGLSMPHCGPVLSWWFLVPRESKLSKPQRSKAVNSTPPEIPETPGGGAGPRTLEWLNLPTSSQPSPKAVVFLLQGSALLRDCVCLTLRPWWSISSGMSRLSPCWQEVLVAKVDSMSPWKYYIWCLLPNLVCKLKVIGTTLESNCHVITFL